MDVQVVIDRRIDERLERLMAIQHQNQGQQSAEKMLPPPLCEAAMKGEVNEFVDALGQVSENQRLNLSTIVNQLSPSGNSLLHIAAKHGKKEITKLMAHHFPFLITKQNLHGDTPLHIAFNTTEILIDCVKGFPGVFSNTGVLLRMKNEKGNTVLHEAVTLSICNEREVDLLVKEDPEVSYWQNNKGKSPLYLAAKKKEVKILDTLLQAIERDSDSLDKLQGKSPLQAAVKRRNLDILQVIVNRKRELLHYKDKKGRSPLHLAASIGFLRGVRFFLDQSSNESAFERDKQGLFPIHLACKNGHVDVSKELLLKWPDPVELLDNKGQNILHFAAKSGQVDVVKFLLTPQLGLDRDKLVNKQDKDGNTPLHLATIHGQFLVVWSIARRHLHCLKIKNNQRMTAYDIADKLTVGEPNGSDKLHPLGKEQQSASNEQLTVGAAATEKNLRQTDSKSSKELDFFDTMMALSVLIVLNIIHLGFAPILKNLKVIKSRQPSQEEINNRINTIMVVAALSAGAAFAAATNMASGISNNGGSGGGGGGGGGGSNNSGDLNSYTKKWMTDILPPLFAVLNVLALKFSLFTAVVILWAQLGDRTLATIAVWIASGVLSVSLYMLCFAFFMAVLLGVANYPIFFFVALVFELGLGCIVTIFAIPIIIPIRYKRVFLVCFCFIIFCLQYIIKRIIVKLICKFISVFVRRRD